MKKGWVSDPFEQIFEINSSLSSLSFDPTGELAYFFKMNPIPKVTKATITRYLSERNQDIGRAVAKSGYSFPFLPDVLKSIVECKGFYQDSEKTHISIFILNSFIAWYQLFSRCKIFDFNLLILKALLYSSSIGFQRASQSAFIFAYSQFLTQSNSIDEDYMGTLEFFIANHFDKESFELILKVIPSVTETHIEEMLFGLIQHILDQNPDFFHSAASDLLINSLSHSIQELKIPALRCLYQLIEKATPMHHVRLFQSFAKKLFDLIENLQEPIPFPSVDQEFCESSIIDTSSPVFKPSFTFIESATTFPSGLTDPVIEFPQPVKITICCKQIFAILLETLSVVPDYVDPFIDSFFVQLKSRERSPKIGNLYAHVVWLCSSLQGKFQKLMTAPTFTHSFLFDYRINLFQGTLTPIVSTLRNQVIEAAVQEGTVSDVLSQLHQYPLLFAEVLYRFNFSLTPQILGQLEESILFYRVHDFKCHTSEIEIARTALLEKIKELTRDLSARKIMVGNQRFMDTYFLHMFEPTLSSLILKQVSYILSSTPLVFCTTTVLSLSSIIAAAFPNTDDDLSISLILNILDVFRFVERHLNEIPECMNAVNMMLFKLLQYLKPTEKCIQLFTGCLQCLTESGNMLTLTNNEIGALDFAIAKIYQGETPRSLYTLLLSLFCGGEDKIKPNFTIHHHIILPILFKIFLKSDLFSDLFNFVLDLCRFSKQNCRSCHSSGIDIVLIGILRTLRMNPDNDPGLIDMLLELFEQIATTASSPTVVKEFISLIAPSSDVLSPFQPNFTRSLFKLVYVDYMKRSRAMLLGHHEPLKMALNKPDFTKGFHIIFWLFIIETVEDEEIQIFEMSDQFSIILKNSTLTIKQSNRQVSINTRLMPYKWIFVSLSFDQKVFVPRIDMFEDTFYNINQIDYSALSTVTIGKQVERMASKVELSSLSLYTKITSVEIDKLFLREDLDKIQPLVRFPVRSTLVDPKDEEVFTFSLVKLWKMDLLIPLFAFSDLPMANGSKWEKSIEYPLLILSRALLYSDEVQKNFADSHHIYEIAHLLSDQVMTYELYSQFYSLFLSLSNTNLRVQIFDAILVNPSLLLSSPPDQHLEIISHWSKVLFPSFEPTCAKVRSFSHMLNISVLYYWDTPYEPELFFGTDISDKPRPPEFDNKMARQYLHNIFMRLATISFTRDDFFLLLSHCKYFTHLEFVESLVLLIHSLVHKIPGTLKQLHLTPNDFQHLHALFLNDKIIAEIIELVIEVYRHGIIDAKEFPSHLESIITSINPQQVNDSFYRHMKNQMVLSTPELVSICCWYAMNKEDSIKTDLLSTLVDVNLSRVEYWSFWVILLSIYSPHNIRNSAIQFIVSREPNNWSEHFHIMNAMLEALHQDSDSIQTNFLAEVLLFFQTHPSITSEDLSTFFRTIFDFIFIRPFYYHNHAISQTFNFSQFGQNWPRKQHKKVDPSDIRQILDLIRKTTTTRKRKFGLRLSFNGQWHDAGLAEEVIRFMVKKNHIETVDLAIFAMFFLAKMDMTFIKEMLNNYKSFWANSSQYSKYLNCLLTPLRAEILLSSFSDLIQNIQEKEFQQLSIDRLKEYCNYHQYQDDAEINISLQSLRERRDIILSQEMDWQKQWNRLWSALSIDCGPWDLSQHSKKQAEHWRRENTLTQNVPAKLKRNSHFTMHDDGKPAFVRQRKQTVDKTDCLLIKCDRTRQVQFFSRKGSLKIGNKEILHKDIKEIFLRTRFHIQNSIEVFTKDGHSYFLEFLKPSASQKVWSNCAKKGVPCFSFNVPPSLVQDWTKRKISNFKYLLLLNMHAGRSFNDLSQYPLFPWTITDFTSPKPDFSNPATFRPFNKPIGALDPDRLSVLKNDYHDMIVDGESPYLYASGPLSSLAVALLLVRLEPFATIHCNFQGNRFDQPTRQLRSIGMLYELISKLTSEYWELPPEFYFSPEFLRNDNQFNFGSVDGETVNDVALPNWAKDAVHFVYIMRKALESDYVSAHLNEWIDLTFGVKQRGEEAVKADNVFNPVLYDSVWSAKQQESPQTIMDTLNLVGQIPPQLFKEPHPVRNGRSPPTLFLPTLVRSIQTDLQITTCLCVEERSNIIFEVVEMSGAISRIKTRFDGNEIVQPEISKKEKDLEFRKAAVNENFAETVLVASDSFYVRQSDGMWHQIKSSHNKIVAAAADGEWVSVSGDDSMTNTYYRGNLEFSMRCYRDMITCCNISEEFKVQVTGTKDGALIVTSLTTGETVRVIELNGSPKKVMVTKGWGFIVTFVLRNEGAFVRPYIVTYTINGQFACETKIESEIKMWTNWTSNEGFDYIMYTIGSKLFIAEVMELKASAVFVAFTNPLKGIGYLVNVNRGYLVEQSGRIIIFPCAPEDNADYL